MTNIPTVVRTVLDRRITLENRIGLLGELAKDILAHGPVSDNDVQRADALLSELEEDLSELIALKESDGFFREILTASPESRHKVDQLMEDHAALLQELSGMRRELTVANHGPTVRRRLHGWIQRFREFDSREISLLQKVWSVDIGSKD